MSRETCKPRRPRHAVVSIRARRPDGTWGNLSAGSLLTHIVAADSLYTLLSWRRSQPGSGGRGNRGR